MLIAAHALVSLGLLAAEPPLRKLPPVAGLPAAGLTMPIRTTVPGAAGKSGGLLRGRIEIESHGIRMPAGARTVRVSRDGESVAEAKTSLDGAFELRIPGGRYEFAAGPFSITGTAARMVRVDSADLDRNVPLLAVAAGSETPAPPVGTAAAESPADAAPQAPITIDAAGRLRVRLVRKAEDGSLLPLAKAEVVAAREGVTVAKSSADADGIVSLPGIEPGALTLLAAREGKSLGAQRIAAILAPKELAPIEPTKAEFKGDGEDLTVFVAFDAGAATVAMVIMAPVGAEQAATVVAGGEVAGCNSCQQVAAQCGSCGSGACGSGGFGGGGAAGGLGGAYGGGGVGLGAGGGLLPLLLGAGALAVGIEANNNNNNNGGTPATAAKP